MVTDVVNWQPTASVAALQLRARLLRQTREFFYERKVLEVETPTLAQYTVTDRHLSALQLQLPGSEQYYYLQTSPEYAMKRLLAAGSGSIYQISKAFRADEFGRHHNPEFTMLEWYRVGFDYHQLMAEVDLLLQTVLVVSPAISIRYVDLFFQHTEIELMHASIEQLQQYAARVGIDSSAVTEQDSRDIWLDLIFSHQIQPELGWPQPVIVYDYPASQAALAALDADGEYAKRFEVYYQSIELANGYHELRDVIQHERRFQLDNERRLALGLSTIAVDIRFMAALQHGLPACAGVALGFDRLVMLAGDNKQLADVISFTVNNA